MRAPGASRLARPPPPAPRPAGSNRCLNPSAAGPPEAPRPAVAPGQGTGMTTLRCPGVGVMLKPQQVFLLYRGLVIYGEIRGFWHLEKGQQH